MISPAAPRKSMVYGRRKGRPLRKTKTALIKDLLPSLEFQLSPLEKLPPSLFQEKNPLWIEIGYGTGDHLVSQLKEHPHCNFIGCEPFLGGIAALLEKISFLNLPLENIRLFTQDARALLRGLDANSVEKVFILFPDPWPKKKHTKRRFLQKETLSEIIRILIPSGTLILASDHEAYFSSMLALVTQHPALVLQENKALPNSTDPLLRPPFWPMTRFENKAHEAKRHARYLILQKSPSSLENLKVLP